MARLVNKTTGAIVNVPDGFIDRLGTEWGPAGKAPAVKPQTRKTANK